MYKSVFSNYLHRCLHHHCLFWKFLSPPFFYFIQYVLSFSYFNLHLIRFINNQAILWARYEKKKKKNARRKGIWSFGTPNGNDFRFSLKQILSIQKRKKKKRTSPSYNSFEGSITAKPPLSFRAHLWPISPPQGVSFLGGASRQGQNFYVKFGTKYLLKQIYWDMNFIFKGKSKVKNPKFTPSFSIFFYLN